MTNGPSNPEPSRPTDIADALRTGQAFDLAASIKAEAKIRQRQEADAVKLQLLVARMGKAAGRNVEQRIFLAALGIMAAQVVMHSPRPTWGQGLLNFLLMTKSAIDGALPKGEKLAMPGLSMPSTGRIPPEAITPAGNDGEVGHPR